MGRWPSVAVKPPPMIRAGVVACVVLALAAPCRAAETVPFVGCPSDGQDGPTDAPAHGTPPPAAPGLAYYASQSAGVLAPIGWHCVGLSGSNGEVLLVTPEAHTAADFLARNTPLAGPAVQLTLRFGDTSGRFDVARVIARLFPARRAFLQRVIDEGLEPASAFPAGPYPADTLQRLSDSAVAFTTPAGKPGMGTASRLVPGADSVDGLAQLSPTNDLRLLDVRLPPELHGLLPAILAPVRR